MSVDNTTFANFGKSFQEKVVQSLLQDYLFADQIADILRPEFFELSYLQEVVTKFFGHKAQFKTYPSIDVVETMIKTDDRVEDLVKNQVNDFAKRMLENHLNGDTGFIQSSSLEFCKKQMLKEAFVKGIDMMESGNYDSIQSVIKDALNKGATRDLGHEYMESFAARGQKSTRLPIPTGWPVLDKVFNGGWERGILATFIAPTGAGKSMFLVNCGAAALAQGKNVLYITCEMADYKIGLRFDSYFSGVEINNVPDHQTKVETSVREQVKGNLYIKEFPTKTATVQTIRAYVQRLSATKNFHPDMIIIDYADLLRGSRGYGDKRFELEGTYEELRALSQELKVVMITADQTNRSGLELEVVTVAQIGEAYSKATVCDVILTVSRRMEDKQTNCGRLFNAKSRLGQDGQVFPFTLNTSTVKVTVLEQNQDPVSMFYEDQTNLKQKLGERFKKFVSSGSNDK